MSRALAIATAILRISHSYVSAQTPTCLPGYQSLYNWTFNSLGESPCNMTISLAEVCYPGGYTLSQLASGSNGYNGANGVTCECSTVFYSLISACAYCQNASIFDWSGYSSFCTTVYDEIFPEPLPTSILVPHYAYLDVVTGNTFNVTAAKSAGGPETTPVPQSTVAASTNGATSTNPTNPTSVPFLTSATSSSTPTSATSTPTSAAATSKGSNVGAIVGGVIAGLAIIVAGIIAFLFLRRHKPLKPSTNTTVSEVTAPGTAMGSGTDRP